MNFHSFGCNSPLSTNKHHSTRGWYEIWLIDAVPLFFFHHHRAYIRHQIFVGGAFAQQRAQIVILLAEEARAKLSVGSEPDARTEPAEGLRYGGDQSDFAAAVGEPEFARRLAALADQFQFGLFLSGQLLGITDEQPGRCV